MLKLRRYTVENPPARRPQHNQQWYRDEHDRYPMQNLHWLWLSSNLLGSVDARPFADIDEMSFDRCRCGHHRADEVRAAALALASFEISIRRAGRAFAARQYVVVHADAHAATGVAPFESRVAENFVEAFFFGFNLHNARPGHHQRLLQGFRHVLSGNHSCSGAQILNP